MKMSFKNVGNGGKTFKQKVEQTLTVQVLLHISLEESSIH